jgi:hypothetical protein
MIGTDSFRLWSNRATAQSTLAETFLKLSYERHAPRSGLVGNQSPSSMSAGSMHAPRL